MKQFLRACSRPVLVLLMVSTTTIFAQEQETFVAVSAPAYSSGTAVMVTLGTDTLRSVLDSTRQALLAFPPHEQGRLSMEVLYRLTDGQGTWARAWTGTVDLNGSGYIEYTLLPDGTGAVGQWPSVTWMSQPGVLDVSLNGSPEGSTRLRKRLEPRRRHTVHWMRGSRTVCTAEVMLPLNVRRTITCDAATGKVIEE